MKKINKSLVAVIAALSVTSAIYADSSTLAVSASVAGACKITATAPIAFTLDSSLASDATALGSVTYWCSSGTAGTFTVGAGLNDVATDKYMVSAGTPTEKIKYSLSPTTDAYTGAGPSTPKTLDITGTVLNADYVSVAALSDYADTVTVDILP